jgi:hypothetical protein
MTAHCTCHSRFAAHIMQTVTLLTRTSPNISKPSSSAWRWPRVQDPTPSPQPQEGGKGGAAAKGKADTAKAARPGGPALSQPEASALSRRAPPSAPRASSQGGGRRGLGLRLVNWLSCCSLKVRQSVWINVAIILDKCGGLFR